MTTPAEDETREATLREFITSNEFSDTDGRFLIRIIDAERAKSEGMRKALEQQLAWLMNQPFEWLHPVQIALVQAALSASPSPTEAA